MYARFLGRLWLALAGAGPDRCRDLIYKGGTGGTVAVSRKAVHDTGVSWTMYRVWLIILAPILASAVVGCSPPEESEELLVFAAASLANALGEVEQKFEQESQVTVAVSFGASQMLAQQIASGAPAELIISAGVFPVEFLSGKGLVEPEWTELLTNKLVVAIKANAGLRLESIEDLGTSKVGRVAVAGPDVAPAGRYARESLIHLGIWDDIQDKLVIGADVRATMAYIESGNADAALVYATDAAVGRNVLVIDIVPEESYSRVVYPAAIIKDSKRINEATAFLEFLTSAEASAIFRAHGFQPLE